jgi:hypothetical protein
MTTNKSKTTKNDCGGKMGKSKKVAIICANIGDDAMQYTIYDI